MFAMRGIERPIAEPMIRTFKGNDATFAGGEQRGFERRFDSLETGVGKNYLPGDRAWRLASGDLGFCSNAQK